MTTMLLDPTAEVSAATRPRLQRPVDLAGLTVGLMDISKPRGDIFLNRIEALLKDRNIQVKRFTKPTFTRVAPTELKQQIAGEVDLVIEGLAD
ncbi:hypothetical protein GP2143_12054 [marine gamma proteobacterium HTCC2143]|jgi:hypothetical protein|uniref:UGSC-like domain-containing protein n=1 Tax=marine gamma proteobacterium HTCC2143 TaxID=247633 RepID=A0YH57_9GAMM|nr:hypothetical protein GP2143_12054 [marine gamma proteobacterium HTCC2143]|tara:strand:+ start:1648 stop:1926 length:279 start_codon:yes stop_codon:yes gene_type:complete